MADERKPQTSLQTLKSVIQKYSPDIQQLIPKHVDAEKMVMIAQAALTKNPDLLKCDPRTVLAGIIQCSIMGLELHTALHHASLLPFWNSKAGIFEAMLMIEYPGLIELVMRGGDTTYVEAQPVYAEDYLEVEFGSNPRLIHRPNVRTTRGKLIGAYAYAKLKSGDVKFHYMTSEDIEKRRAVSKAKDSGPWKGWEEEMYAKTPLRHLCKQLRKTTELAMAMEHENRFDSGVTSVVENSEGLSLDFLSMNVEAKTIEAKTDLKGRIAAKSESSRPSAVPAQAVSTAPAAPPAAAGTQSQPAPAAPVSQQAPPVETTATPFVATDDDFPADFYDRPALPPEDAELPPPQPDLPIETPPAAAPAPETTQHKRTPAPRAPSDPLDKAIEPSEVQEILVLIKKTWPDNTEAAKHVRPYLDGLTPKATLVRNLTVRQYREMVEWFKQQQA